MYVKMPVVLSPLAFYFLLPTLDLILFLVGLFKNKFCESIKENSRY